MIAGEAAGASPRDAAPLMVVGASGWLGRAVLGAASRTGPVVGTARGECRRRDLHPAHDLHTLSGLLEAFAPRAVINCGGLTTGSEDELYAANGHWAEVVADACANAGTPLLHVGSSAEYGDPGKDPVPEEHDALPLSPYGRSKLAGSIAVLGRRRAGACCSVARVFNLVGPAQPAGMPTKSWAEQIKGAHEGRVSISVGDPSFVRDFRTLDGVARDLAELATRLPNFDLVNVASGIGTSFGALIAAMGEKERVSITLDIVGASGIPTVVADVRRLRGLLPEWLPESLIDLARAAMS